MAPTLFQGYDIGLKLRCTPPDARLKWQHELPVGIFVPFALALFLLWMDRLEIKVLHPHGSPEGNNAAAEITDLPLTSADAETPDPTGEAKNFLSSDEK
ncbi:hypothetical protein [Corynebacterium ulcerans]|uniref:hypothetical protein n=1 Tax=Corynebacterium ulcerans TaxID=65058 RepID=UPI0036F1E0CA